MRSSRHSIYTVLVYLEFKICNGSVDLRATTTKLLYSYLLQNRNHIPKIVEINPTVDFKYVFKDVFNKFVDRFSRDVIFEIVHGILPTNSLMCYYNIYKFNTFFSC